MKVRTKAELVKVFVKEIQAQTNKEDDFNTGVYNLVSAFNQALGEMNSDVFLINRTQLRRKIDDLGLGI